MEGFPDLVIDHSRPNTGSFSFFFFSSLILFLAVLCLHCYAGFSLVEVSGVYSLVAVPGLPRAAASLIADHGLQSTGSVVVAHGLSCSQARDQTPVFCIGRWILYH